MHSPLTMRTPAPVNRNSHERAVTVSRTFLAACAFLVSMLCVVSLPAETKLQSFVSEHCSACHADKDSPGQLDLVALSNESPEAHAEAWERVLRKLQSRQMPPEGEPQPEAALIQSVIEQVATELDRAYFERPKIASTDALRRLTRTEYQNAVRDLLGVEIDATSLLPPDEASHGFDNITVSDLSPTFLNRAISAAQKISHLAVGGARHAPGGETYRVRPDITQEEHVPGLPIGTRGGTLIKTSFPQAGEYEITVRLARDRNEEVEGLKEPHELEILVDRRRVELFKVEPPPDRKDFSNVDLHLKVRTTIAAGVHSIGATFIKKPSSLLETKRQPYNAHYNMHRHPRLGPAVYQVSITGPYRVQDEELSDTFSGSNFDKVPSNGVTASTSKEHSDQVGQGSLFAKPASDADDPASAQENLRRVMRLAYRRPITAEDLREPMRLYEAARSTAGFAGAMEQALAAVLVNPNFLFKIEQTPARQQAGEPYRVNDLELATRLSFFLWSSLPDDQLLKAAEQGRLHEPDELHRQVERMLRDARSQSLVDNFAEQWLYLRNLESITPDLRLFPDFDDNLRQAFRQETKLLFEGVMREDRSVLDLLSSNATFLNERLAKHYGIPHIYGSRFRRVELDPASHRGGLLRHGSILTVTSYATRTSPVIRGHWILKNIVGSPPPPPPADVPALKDNTVDATLSMRERLAEHRAHAACAVCHNLMDPVGFAMENFDAIGRWREIEDGAPIDSSGGLAGAEPFEGVDGLEKALLARPELFVSTMTEKLMTFALGRGVDVHDGPAIRRIVDSAKADDYTFSATIQGIVSSPPFQLRSAP